MSNLQATNAAGIDYSSIANWSSTNLPLPVNTASYTPAATQVWNADSVYWNDNSTFVNPDGTWVPNPGTGINPYTLYGIPVTPEQTQQYLDLIKALQQIPTTQLQPPVKRELQRDIVQEELDAISLMILNREDDDTERIL